MITISNKQREDIVRYLDLLCQTLEGDSTRIFNTKRIARKCRKRSNRNSLSEPPNYLNS